MNYKQYLSLISKLADSLDKASELREDLKTNLMHILVETCHEARTSTNCVYFKIFADFLELYPDLVKTTEPTRSIKRSCLIINLKIPLELSTLEKIARIETCRYGNTLFYHEVHKSKKIEAKDFEVEIESTLSRNFEYLVNECPEEEPQGFANFSVTIRKLKRELDTHEMESILSVLNKHVLF